MKPSVEVSQKNDVIMTLGLGIGIDKSITNYIASGGDPAPTFSLSSERCLLVGAIGSNDYVSFGDFSIHPTTFDETYPWRFGSDHNAGANGSARLFTKQNGLDPIYGPIIVEPDGAGNITNVSGNWANNNRFILFWLEINGTNGDLYYRYSDDLYLNITTPASATWSARTRMTTDFGTGQANTYIDGPGQFIVLQNGDLLKPCWCNNGIVNVYVSTAASNGLAWTLRGTITTDTINPCDETSIVQLDNGTICAALRCNSLALIRTSTSSNSGTTWSSLVTTDIPSYGKPALTQYNNYIFGIAREFVSGFTSNRTIFFKSADFVSFTRGFLDNRLEPYMYGQPRYHAGEGKIIIGYAAEGANGTPLQDPTRIIRKEITLTTSTAPTAYHTEYQSLLDFAQAGGVTLPSDAQKVIDSTFVSTAPDLDSVDGYYVAKHNNASLSGFSRYNWKKPWFIATLGDAPTYGVNGFDFDGVNDFFDTLIQPNLQANFLQNDAEITFYTDEEGTTVGVELGCNTGTFATRANPIMLELRFTTNAAFYAINGPATLSTVANSTAAALWEMKRTSSTTIELWKNGSLFASASTTSTGRSSTTLIVGAERFGNGNFLFNPRRFGLVVVSGVKSSWNTPWNTRLTALGF